MSGAPGGSRRGRSGDGPDRDGTGEEAGAHARAELREIARGLPDRLDADPEGAGRDLGRLVLTLVEFLRQILEHQAIRRMEAGSLTEEEEERLGLGLLRLQEQLEELKDVFDLTDEQLNVDLGPLGRLL